MSKLMGAFLILVGISCLLASFEPKFNLKDKIVFVLTFTFFSGLIFAGAYLITGGV